MTRIKFLSISAALTVVSVIIIALLYEKVHPAGGINVKYDHNDIRLKSSALLSELDLSNDNIEPVIKLRSDDEFIRQVQNKLGSQKSNQVLAGPVPGYFWQVEFKNSPAVVIGNSKRNVENSTYSMQFDTWGNLLNFSRTIADSVKMPKLSREEARNLADKFVEVHTSLNELKQDSAFRKKDSGKIIGVSISWNSSGNYEFKNEQKTELENRTDYQFNYSALDKTLGDTIQVNVKISGNQVSEFKKEYIFQRDNYSSGSFLVYDPITKIIFYLVIAVTIIFTGLKRIRAFEIGFRTAIIMGIIVALGVALELYFTLDQGMGWEIFIPLIFGPLIYGGFCVIVWAVAETVTREAWNEKMISIDLITKGHVMHSRVGKSFLSGITGGLIVTAVFLLILGIAGSLIHFTYVPDREQVLEPWSSPLPGLTIFSRFIYTSIFTVSVFYLFIISSFKKRLSTSLLLIAGAVLWGIINTKNINPLLFSVIIECIVGLLLVYLFYKFDLLSVIAGLAVFSMALNGTALFFQPHSFFVQSAYFISAILIMIFIISALSLFTKDSITDYQNITPVFVKNITERQRLHRELEIARDVQMSFLPKNDPDFKGLDVASRCIPALEVGGDYYDFVHINENKSGIIIGDVSGKGTQAAFYMILTKGFLKAISRICDSPAELLSQMNELFYQNVERGTFISMIYGVFDIKEKKFHFARGGHNPVIVKSSGGGNAEMLNPTGLALGLEKGVLFRKNIQELELPIRGGEVYIFYTDGFTEAMNRNKDEFGEERLMGCVEANAELSAHEILDKIFEEVKSFMGKTNQHDDMTMVVVKIKDLV